jgi:hypothetical protein
MKTTLVLAFTLTAGSAFAQQAPATTATAPAVRVDSRFAAWIGCWRLDDDLSGTGARMCITPDKSGVRLQTVAGTQRGIDELVIPDGVARPIVDSDCKGTEKAEWSKDAARIFRTTEVTCGKEAPRTVTSVAFMAPGPSWINVQHVTGTLSRESVRVQRYRRAFNQKLADGTQAPQPEESLTMRTTPEVTTWGVEDVIEASSRLPVPAVQAALTEVHHPFELNKKALIALDDSGVDDSVIDLMVALSYPKRFVVQRAGGGGGGAPVGIATGTGWFDPFLSPMMMGSMYDCYSPYGYGYRSYYSLCGSPFYNYGYRPYGYYGGYYGWVDVGTFPPGTGGGGGSVAPQPEGRAVNGRGYTQVRDRESEPAPRVSHSGNGGGWQGSGSSGGVSSGGYSSGSASGGSSGSSGGGGGDSGARTAVPKGGGR